MIDELIVVPFISNLFASDKNLFYDYERLIGDFLNFSLPVANDRKESGVGSFYF